MHVIFSRLMILRVTQHQTASIIFLLIKTRMWVSSTRDCTKTYRIQIYENVENIICSILVWYMIDISQIYNVLSLNSTILYNFARIFWILQLRNTPTLMLALQRPTQFCTRRTYRALKTCFLQKMCVAYIRIDIKRSLKYDTNFVAK